MVPCGTFYRRHPKFMKQAPMAALLSARLATILRCLNGPHNVNMGFSRMQLNPHRLNGQTDVGSSLKQYGLDVSDRPTCRRIEVKVKERAAVTT
jgi:hypothetical protein